MLVMGLVRAGLFRGVRLLLLIATDAAYILLSPLNDTFIMGREWNGAFFFHYRGAIGMFLAI